jgi:hypothetical protein
MPHEQDEIMALPTAAEELASALALAASRRNRTPHCWHELELYRDCRSGWKPEFHAGDHPSNCKYCTGVVLRSFRAKRPGFRMLQEEKSRTAERPLWWRQAIEEYLKEDAPLLRWLTETLQSASEVGFAQFATSTAGAARLAGSAAGEEPAAFDPDDVLFYSKLTQETVAWDASESKERRGKPVLLVLGGENGMIVRKVVLQRRQENWTGSTVVSETEIRALGGALTLFPPRLLTDEVAETVTAESQEE